MFSVSLFLTLNPEMKCESSNSEVMLSLGGLLPAKIKSNNMYVLCRKLSDVCKKMHSNTIEVNLLTIRYSIFQISVPTSPIVRKKNRKDSLLSRLVQFNFSCFTPVSFNHDSISIH